MLEEGVTIREETASASKPWRRSYRNREVFERLTTWLRKNGVEGNKPLHSLRKEAGSIVATASGIFAASRFLRHRDIGLTASVYADQKSRVTVNMSAFLPQENVIALQKMLIAIRRGELIEQAVVLKQAGFLLTALRQRALSAPSASARKLVGIDDPREMVERLRG